MNLDRAQTKKQLETIHNTLTILFSLDISNNPTLSDLLIKCQKNQESRQNHMRALKTKFRGFAFLWALALL